ncbi:OPT oligopeptide transporter protein-domain-containing protein [Cladochytrium replicatum]|nr:OPT oligopeptide transporter protein-domain-containing protein [Cladochytrium replicatum]
MAGAVVPNTDDPRITHLSIRAWVLGTFWCVGMAAANGILAFRTNSIVLDPTLATLLTYPMGLLLAKFVPSLSLGRGTWEFNMNPPFTLKEHCLVSIMASAGSAGAYSVYNVVSQRYNGFMANTNVDFAQSLAWVVTTQMIGFGIAGLARRFLVKPAAMLWPSILPTIALFVSLHQKEDPEPRTSGTKWSVTVQVLLDWAGLHFSLRAHSESLQTISVLCLLSSASVARFLGSASPPISGPGLLSLTLDLQYLGKGVFVIPWIYQIQSYIGNWLMTYAVATPLFLSNAFGRPEPLLRSGDPVSNQTVNKWYFNSVWLFDHEGRKVNPRVLYRLPDYGLNETVYGSTAPIYISEFFAVSYLIEFMVLPAMVVHVVCWYGKDIYRQFKAALHQVNDEMDIHNKLMGGYKEVPEWLFAAWLLLWTIALCVVCTVTEFRMPIYGGILATAVSSVLILPLGIIQAITGTVIGLNVLQQFIGGLLMPGNTVAVMCFKSIGFNTTAQAVTLLTDLKMGHYLKIPPYCIVAIQITGTLLGSLVYLSVTWWMIFQQSITLGQGDWQLIGYQTFYNAGAIWGAIGPRRFFGIGSVYQNLLWGFLVGAIAPIIPFALSKIHPLTIWPKINLPVIIFVAGVGEFQNQNMVGPIVGFVFMHVLFHRAKGWWRKYNYVLASAVAGGVASAILVATALDTGGAVFPKWILNPSTYFAYYCYGLSYDGFSSEG